MEGEKKCECKQRNIFITHYPQSPLITDEQFDAFLGQSGWKNYGRKAMGVSSNERTGGYGVWDVDPLMPDIMVGRLRLASLFGKILVFT